jgi:hypothetical protein
MDQDSKLTLERTSPDDVKQRQVIVKLDGEKIGDLMYGKTITRSIEPGAHTMRLDNTWNKKTIQFKVEPGEEAKFQVVNRPGRFTWFLVAALGAGPMYVSAERVQESNTKPSLK